MKFLKSLLLTTALFIPLNLCAKDQDYAVLINGDYTSSRERHSKNIDMAYKCLQKEGYVEGNIYVVSSENKGYQNYSEGTVANVERVFDELASKIDDTDVVFIYTTGHGSSCEKGSDIRLGKTGFHARELLAKLEKINAEYFIYIGDQCNSGGFVSELPAKLKKVVAMSDMSSTESVLCEPYADEFWKYNQDLNGDGVVTLKEAHTAAAKKEIEKEGSTPKFRIKELPEDVQISRYKNQQQLTPRKKADHKDKIEALLRKYRKH